MSPNEIDNEEIKIYLEEMDELTQILEEDIVKIEKYPDDPSLLAEMFRAAHTIKGSSATMGFTELAELTHAMETVFDALRNGAMSVSINIINIFLQCTDLLRIIRGEITGHGRVTTDIKPLHQALKALTTGEQQPPRKASRKKPEAKPEPAQRNQLNIKIDVSKECLMPFARAFQVLSFLSEIGEVVKSSPTAAEIEREKRSFPIQIVLLTGHDEGKTRQVLEMISDIIIMDIQTGDIPADVPETPEKSESPEPPPPKPQAPSPIVETTPEPKTVPPVEPAPSSKAEPTPPPPEGTAVTAPRPTLPPDAEQKQQAAKPASQSVRIDLERVDAIVDLVGELVINRTRLLQLSRDLEARHESDETVKQLNETSDRIELITALLQEQVMRTRLFPLENIFHRFPRMIRDLSAKAGKQIEFVIRGEKTELDRSVLEEIGDPLMHVLRNAVDHGIEAPQEREKAGKPAIGTIRISANHVEDYILITVEDDGRGIDTKKVLQKAKAMKIVPDAMLDRLGERDLMNLVFHAGFSTKETVSDVSGRGVGMDVVRTNIEKMNGSVTLDSTLGKGMKVTIKLPLTLAIIRSLLVTVERRIFAVPLNSVVQTVRIEQDQMQQVKGTKTIMFRGSVLPIFNLGDVLCLRTAERESAAKRMFVVVVSWAGKNLGLIVDSLIGDQEMVIRPLGEYIGEIPGISGATILGDGRIALIVDVGGIVKRQPGELEAVMRGGSGGIDTLETAGRKSRPASGASRTSPDEKPVWVNLAEYTVSQDPAETLIAHGVGSCVICCAYDRVVPVAGMAHIMLPVLTGNHRRTADNAGYADVGIPQMIGAMRDAGAIDARIVVKIAGGASVVKTGASADRDIGGRNLRQVQEILKKMGLTVVFEDVGGTHWRTVRFHTGTGRLVITDGRKREKVCDVNSLRAHRQRQNANRK